MSTGLATRLEIPLGTNWLTGSVWYSGGCVARYVDVTPESNESSVYSLVLLNRIRPRIAAALIMNDDVDGAESGLSEGTSSFHNVCGLAFCYPDDCLHGFNNVCSWEKVW